MKAKTKIFLLIALATALLIGSCTIVVSPSYKTWTLYYTWQGASQQRAYWYLYSNGTFKDSYGGRGTWTLSGTFFQLGYDNSSYFYYGTVYTGSIYGSDYMSGNMQGPDQLGILRYGVWKAYLGIRGTSKEAQSAGILDASTPILTPSGEQIDKTNLSLRRLIHETYYV